MNTNTSTEKKPAAGVVPIELIKVADICPDPKNQRRDDEDGLVRLCASIERDGLIQPITVRINPGADDGNPKTPAFMIVAGERRWEAHRMLKMETIQARVIIGDSQLDSVRKRAVENLIRENLNPIQEARQYAELMDTGMSQTEAAEMAGVDQSTMSNRMRILKLPLAVQKMLETGKLSRAHGIALLRFEKWPDLLMLIATLAGNRGVSSKALEKGLPFAGHDEMRDHAVEVWHANLPKAWKDDPDVMDRSDEDEVGSGYVYVLDVKRWKKSEADEMVKRAKEADAARASGKPSLIAAAKVKAERAAAIERNTRHRADVKVRLAKSMRALRDKRVPASLVAAYLVKAAVAGSFGRNRIMDAFAALGLKIAPGVLPAEGSYGMRDVSAMRKMKAEDLLSVALVVLIAKEADDAVRDASAMPHSLEQLANYFVEPKPVPAKSAARKAKPAAKKAVAHKWNVHGVCTNPSAIFVAGMPKGTVCGITLALDGVNWFWGESFRGRGPNKPGQSGLPRKNGSKFSTPELALADAVKSAQAFFSTDKEALAAINKRFAVGSAANPMPAKKGGSRK